MPWNASTTDSSKMSKGSQQGDSVKSSPFKTRSTSSKSPNRGKKSTSKTTETIIIYPVMNKGYSSRNRNAISHYVSTGRSPQENVKDKRFKKVTQKHGRYKSIIKRVNLDLDTEDETINITQDIVPA